MEIRVKINLDDDQVKGRVSEIADSVDFAIQGALHLYRDGENRHGQVIAYDIEMEEYYGASDPE